MSPTLLIKGRYVKGQFWRNYFGLPRRDKKASLPHTCSLYLFISLLVSVSASLHFSSFLKIYLPVLSVSTSIRVYIYICMTWWHVVDQIVHLIAQFWTKLLVRFWTKLSGHSVIASCFGFVSADFLIMVFWKTNKTGFQIKAFVSPRLQRWFLWTQKNTT